MLIGAHIKKKISSLCFFFLPSAYDKKKMAIKHFFTTLFAKYFSNASLTDLPFGFVLLLLLFLVARCPSRVYSGRCWSTSQCCKETHDC